MMLSSAVLAFYAWKGWEIGRATGGLLLLSYVGYLTALFVVT